jgi:hypothetical protein
MGMYELLRRVDTARRQLDRHPLYEAVDGPDSLRLFMQSHVFAVWDFMSLLKALQRNVTCVTLPWLAAPLPTATRLINEIVLEEESDDCGELGFLSHFRLYRLAMEEAGADCGPIDAFTGLVAEGQPVEAALARSGAPLPARIFVGATFALLEEAPAHALAAAFAFGREDPIPRMFRRLLASIETGRRPRSALLRHYLERHIGLDEDHHTPLAVRMVAELCGEEPAKWRASADAAHRALAARLDLWSGVHGEIELLRAGVPLGRVA